MKWKRLLKDYDKLNVEDKDIFKQQLLEKLNFEESQEETYDVDEFVEEEHDFNFQKELEECDCDCDCECNPTETEFEYLQKLDMRISVARNLTYLTNPDGTSYFPIEWIAENILKLKK